MARFQVLFNCWVPLLQQLPQQMNLILQRQATLC